MTLKCNTDCCHSFGSVSAKRKIFCKIHGCEVDNDSTCEFLNMPERRARRIIESNSNPKKTPQRESVETIINELF